MRLTGKFYTLENRPAEISLRLAVDALPGNATVSITDVLLQAGADPTGLVPNPREVGTVNTGVQRWANGAVIGDMVIVALSNTLASTPARVAVEGVDADVQIGDMHFGRVNRSAWADARTHSNSQGWGRPPTITERSDLRLAAKIGDTGDDWEPKPGERAHARLSWIEREDSFDPKPESSLKWGEKTGNWDDQGYTWEEGL